MDRDSALIKLADNKKLFLTKGTGWKDDYIEALIIPLLNSHEPSGVERVKGSKSTRIWKVNWEGGPIIIKFFDIRGIRDKLFFRKSRAWRAMSGDMLLSQNGFLVPGIIAQGDLVRHFRLVDNFLISEWIEGLNTYAYMRAFYAPPLSDEALQNKRIAIKSAGHLIGRMHKNGIFHGDLRPGNIIIKAGDNRSFYFIDNERTKYFSGGIPMRLRKKNLIQINMIVMPQITFTDRMRFFKAYLSENPELMTIAKDLIRTIFLKTKKRLSKKIPGIWEKHNGQN